MAEKTAISWCDHTFNPWIGCTKVTPACDGCYAEARMDLWLHKAKWGNHPRVRTSAANWLEPVKWNKAAEAAGTRPFVFCASLADVFDNQVDPEWRADLFELIRITPQLVWLLLTKRPQKIVEMIRTSGAIAGNGTRYLPGNCALGTTIEDQKRADINVPELLHAKEQCGPAFAFVSCEPLLGPVELLEADDGAFGTMIVRLPKRRPDIHPPIGDSTTLGDAVKALGGSMVPKRDGIDWVIAGGETNQGAHKARPTHPDWLRNLRDGCEVAGIPFHFKQWGEWAPGECAEFPATRTEDVASLAAGKWFFEQLTPRVSAETHVDEQPDVYRLGKGRSGRKLDGAEHNARPLAPELRA